MSAAIRLIRATRVFAIIFLSYMWQMSWARLWPTRYATGQRWKKIHRRNARRMYRGFVRLRGVYIKLGQILSIMGTFLPKEYVEELEGLQDDVPPQTTKIRERSGLVWQARTRCSRRSAGARSRRASARPGHGRRTRPAIASP
jgi:predicted unusual protein kinase regulating ubiquinone biosynthesis (AarF/ABC1/UbiB family)